MNKISYMRDLNLGRFSAITTAGYIFTFRSDPAANAVRLGTIGDQLGFCLVTGGISPGPIVFSLFARVSPLS